MLTLPIMCRMVTKPTKLRLMMMTIVCEADKYAAELGPWYKW